MFFIQVALKTRDVCELFQDINTLSKILRIPLNEDTCIISKGFRAGFFLGISDSPNVLGMVNFN